LAGSDPWQIVKQGGINALAPTDPTQWLKLVLLDNATIENCQVEMKVMVVNPIAAGDATWWNGLEIIARDGGANCWIKMYRDATGFTYNDSDNNLATATPLPAFVPGQWYDFKIVVNGSTVQLYVNGVLTITENNVSTSPGKISIISDSVDTRFADIQVTDLNACDVTSTNMLGAVVDNTANKVTETVDNDTTSQVIDVTPSPNATWKLYSDANCTTEITDKTMNLSVGDNNAYIQVTAPDGTTTKVYKVVITREASSSSSSSISSSSKSNTSSTPTNTSPKTGDSFPLCSILILSIGSAASIYLLKTKKK
jgi:hypothetical protein